MSKKMSFEEAKKKWLIEVVKGRSWAQMMDDHDAEMDAKALALITPEYLDIWERASKEADVESDHSDNQ